MNTILPRGLIVSCQALKNEPLYGGDTMPKMAEAARRGGAVGIRANTVRDINAINRHIRGALPIIGLIKQTYSGSPVYITPTLKELKALIRSKCDVIAIDATLRPRPHGESLEELVAYARAHSNKALLADVATFDEAVNAEKLGFDYVSTTLRGYTEDTKGIEIPDLDFCRQLFESIKQSVLVVEGGIHSFEALNSILDIGIGHIVIGGAITRPQQITGYFVDVFAQNPTFQKKE